MSEENDLKSKLDIIRRAAEERDAETRAKALDLGYVDVRKTPTSIDALRLIEEEVAKAAKVAALQLKVDVVAVAAYDPRLPQAEQAKKILEQRGYKVNMFVASESGLQEVWRMYRFVGEAPEDITGKIDINEEEWKKLQEQFPDFRGAQKTFAALSYGNVSTTDLFKLMLTGALATRTSDIHMEAEELGGKFRYRIDGILHDVAVKVPERNYKNIVSRVKLLSALKLNVHEETQDGRFTIRMVDRDIEMRVSVIPSQYGETIVMRILDPRGINVTLEQLGLRTDDLELIQKELSRPNGLILNTGPTGSGKTTTLYTFLRTVSTPDVKIITVEDPVEYHLPGISQTQIDPVAGYTFASGLRAILRQDPDIILVGEIRDLETAEIAMNASLTGHLVFSTLHTNDAIGAVPRFVDLGVKPAILGPALTLVIAQRLVRKLCEHCRKPTQVTPEIKAKLDVFLAGLPKRVNRAEYQNPTIFEPGGCDVCNGFGYKGRVGIYEFLRKTPELEELIAKGVTILELRKVAEAQEMIYLQEDGILKVMKGVTSLAEIEDITGPIEWDQMKKQTPVV
ncbi:MAG: type II/IV secretion system protein [Anaplasmataceae bacterium]|nr:type II/IV secretion system protein [Anaplasmataceae bacterium]